MDDIPLYRGKRKNILVISGGGIKGFSALGAVTRLKELEIIPGNTNPKIIFKKYNWNLFPGNYKTENNE